MSCLCHNFDLDQIYLHRFFCEGIDPSPKILLGFGSIKYEVIRLSNSFEYQYRR